MEDHVTPQERASRWVVRIAAGPLTPEERQELREWIASDPENGKTLDTLAMLFSNASRAKFPHVVSGARERPSANRFSFFTRPYGAAFAACALVLVAVVSSTVYLSPPSSHSADYATAIGRTQEVSLDDGSKIHLNTASATHVIYSSNRRLIVLERGEGFFEVAKDRSRPFDVVVGDTIVRAVGTKFSVRQHEQGRVEVAVTEGVVELLQKDSEGNPRADKYARPVRLARGNSGVQVGNVITVSTKEEKVLEDKLAWLQGRLSFDGAPLGEAIAEVNRYSTEKIVITDASLKDLKVSGSFNLSEVSVFLSGLEQGIGLRVSKENGEIRIARKDS